MSAEVMATACPWCHIELEVGVRTAGYEDEVRGERRG
jgi:heterodisulfide reductase subunit B